MVAPPVELQPSDVCWCPTNSQTLRHLAEQFTWPFRQIKESLFTSREARHWLNTGMPALIADICKNHPNERNKLVGVRLPPSLTPHAK
jgi:hypothetical protein